VAAPDRDPSTPRWHRRPEARPEEILQAAQAVFGEAGFTRTKLDDVARRAGVSKGTLYLYFDSKETLFREMVRATVLPIMAEGEEIVRQHRGSCRDLLIRIVERMWGTVREPRMARMSRLVTSELSNFPELARFYYDEVVVRGRRLVASVIERGIISGEFRPSALEFVPRAIPSLLVHSAQVQCFFGEYEEHPLSDEQVLRGAIDFVLGGVVAHPATPSSNRVPE
jgi:AcrR family transcriptional regulator